MRVVIVGGLPDGGDRAALLRMLEDNRADIGWDWIQPINAQFSLPHKPFARLLHELRTLHAAVDPPRLVVVKLFHLNGKEAHTLHGACGDPVLAPSELATIEELAVWVLSPEAGVVPPTTWVLPVRQVALFAVLGKLVRNKSWNKDGHGHMWTAEDDLQGQAPVNRPSHPRVYGEALACLASASGTLLLKKGGSQTRKEWCINTAYLPAVKRAIVGRNLDPLRAEPDLGDLMAFVDGGPEEIVEVDSVIISEKVVATCREARSLETR
jgi:hypothetical protein